MELDRTITLSDGRILGFATYGDVSGYPILYFHGGQESRLSSKFMHETAKKLKVQIIAPDRPGIGRSSFQPDRSFLDWAIDLKQLVATLKIERYSIFGLSGGAPHVLSCLLQPSPQLAKASIISGATPYTYRGTLKGMWLPVKLIHWFAGMKRDKLLKKFIQNDFDGLSKNPEKRLKQFQKHLPRPDRELLVNTPAYGLEFIEGSLESYKQGIDGVVQEWKLYVSDWQIDLSQISHPVTLWYGADDKMAPKYRGHYYAKELKNSTLHELANEGHFSLIRNHLAEILSDLRPS